MYRKLLLSGIIIFSCIITGDLTHLLRSKLPTPAFDLTKTDHPDKKRPTDATPFWETGKKNNAVDTAALKQSNWYADVIKNIEAGEYEISKDDRTGRFGAPNRQQQLRTSFNYNSFTMQPRNEGQAWTLRMQLCGIYADKKLIAKPGENDLPVIGSNKIVFNNTNFSTEYINSKEGVRQNFIIQKEPSNKPQTINIKLQTGKGWYINKVHDKELHFAKVEGDQLSKKITYNSLKVWDANNTELTARFVVNKKHTAFEIEVNTADAVYPITIDPISTTPSVTLSGITPGDRFGFSVASAGDVNGDGYSDVVVGAIGVAGNKGAAYIFLGSSTGLSSSFVTVLNGISANDQFGVSVSGAGDVNGDGFSDIVVGAHNVSANTGAAYIFLGSSAVFSSSPIQTLNGVSAGDNFGYSVACGGDVNGDGFSDVIVGAYGVSSFKGAAYIFLGSSGVFSSSPIQTLDGVSAGDNFGYSLACAGDVNGDGFSDVIVGALNVSAQAGAAYIFLGSSGVFSTFPAKTFNGISTGDRLGSSVACAGDVNGDGYSDMVVGAYGVSSFKGAAYIFLGSSGVISSIPAATLNGTEGFGTFGGQVACAGDVNGDGYSDVIVSAIAVPGGTNVGAVYIFLGSNGVFSSAPATTLNGIGANGYFGKGIACAGDVNGDGYSDLVIGAYGVLSITGAAYVYHGSPDGLKTTNNWATESNNNEANYGLSVASAGDVNSDGFSDVLVGAYIFSVSYREGKAFLYLGSTIGLSTTAAWTAVGTMNSEYFGSCVAGAGDVNGDGYGDVLVGAYGYTNPQAEEGRAYLYYGSAGGLAGAAWSYENNVATSILGRSLAAAGDVNGDGYGDIIIGGPQFASPDVNEGIVYVFYGTSTVPASTPVWSTEGNQVGAFYGVSVASLGDVNGDGYSDIIIGAHTYDSPDIDEGKVFAFYGSVTGLPAVANWTAESNQPNAQFGVSVASAGDVNGDGYSDAIIGAYLYDNPTADEGAVFVYYGSSTGLSVTANWTAESNVASSLFGYTVSSAGDVNGDGYSDVLVGAREISNPESREGAMYAYYGSSTGLSLSTSWYVESNVAGILLGNSVASAGDVNGDGYSDVIAGAPYFANPTYREGAAFVYYGNNNTGLRHNLKLYNTDLTAPISHFNVTEPNLFGAGLFSKSPLGRVKGKLVWEVKKQGDAFSGNPITNSTAFLGKGSYTDLGIAGIELKYTVQKVGLRNNKVRARVEYDKVTAITGQLYGPWRYPPAYLQGAHGMNSIPLPVKLNSFTGALVAEKVKLQWLSSDDENVATYQIERSSDNRNFTAIGIVSSVHQNSRTYNFTDNQPLKGTSWYRLKIMDEYNRINYSGTVAIKNTNDAVTVYPTVISRGELINLQFKNSVTGTLEIRLVNMNGATVFKKAMAPNGNMLLVDLPSLSSGVYILYAMQHGEKLITQKIIIR